MFPSKDVLILITGTCDYYLTWKKTLCRCNGFRALRWSGYPVLSRWDQSNLITWVLERWGIFPAAVRETETERERWLQKRGQRNRTSLVLKMEGGATVQEMWEDSISYNKQGYRLSPEAFRKVCNPANTLILVQKDPFQISEPQNYRTANVCWVKPLKLWCNLLQWQQWPLLKNKCLEKPLFCIAKQINIFSSQGGSG